MNRALSETKQEADEASTEVQELTDDLRLLNVEQLKAAVAAQRFVVAQTKVGVRTEEGARILAEETKELKRLEAQYLETSALDTFNAARRDINKTTQDLIESLGDERAQHQDRVRLYTLLEKQERDAADANNHLGGVWEATASKGFELVNITDDYGVTIGKTVRLVEGATIASNDLAITTNKVATATTDATLPITAMGDAVEDTGKKVETYNDRLLEAREELIKTREESDEAARVNTDLALSFGSLEEATGEVPPTLDELTAALEREAEAAEKAEEAARNLRIEIRKSNEEFLANLNQQQGITAADLLVAQSQFNQLSGQELADLLAEAEELGIDPVRLLAQQNRDRSSSSSSGSGGSGAGGQDDSDAEGRGITQGTAATPINDGGPYPTQRARRFATQWYGATNTWLAQQGASTIGSFDDFTDIFGPFLRSVSSWGQFGHAIAQGILDIGLLGDDPSWTTGAIAQGLRGLVGAPRLAQGGMVMPRLGGTFTRLAEAGRPEVVLPINTIPSFAAEVVRQLPTGATAEGGRGGGDLHITINAETLIGQNVTELIQEEIHRAHRRGWP